MRTAIVSGFFGSVVFGSVVFAVISSAAFSQETSKPVSEPPPGRQKPADPPLSVLCAPGTTIQLGVAYASSVIASGGSGAYQFDITGGALPAGIGLNPATGTMTGTTTA
jgi:hypothetical protein